MCATDWRDSLLVDQEDKATTHRLISRPVALLHAAGLTVADIAEAMNLDRSTVSHWLTGSRPAPPELLHMIRELTNATTEAMVASAIVAAAQ